MDEFTPNLQTRERFGQDLFSENRVRMRGAEDPPSPLNNVLHEGLGFEQVVACVGIESCRRRIGVDSNAGRCGCARYRPAGPRLGAG